MAAKRPRRVVLREGDNLVLQLPNGLKREMEHFRLTEWSFRYEYDNTEVLSITLIGVSARSPRPRAASAPASVPRRRRRAP